MIRFLLRRKHNFFFFLREFFSSRRFSGVFVALFTLFVGGSLIAFVLIAYNWSNRSQDRYTMYRKAADNALAQEDYETALLNYRKLMYAGKDDPETMTRYALALIESDDAARGNQIMTQLAPADEEGHGAAHFWQAMQLINNSSRLTPEQAKELKHHLQVTLKQTPQHAEARALLGRYYLSIRKPLQAIVHLEKIVSEKPSERMALARAYALTGQKNQAVQSAHIAIKYYDKLRQEKTEDLQILISEFQAFLFLEDFPNAEKLLRSGPPPDKKPEMHQAWVRLFVAAGRNTQKLPLNARTHFLQRALALEPQNTQVAALLSKLIVQHNSPLQQGVLKILKEYLKSLPEQKQYPQAIHVQNVALARICVQLNEQAEAIKCYESLIDALPEMRLELATTHHNNKSEKAAQKVAKDAVKFFEQQQKKSPSIQTTIQLAQAHQFLKDWRKSRTILEQGIQEVKNQPEKSALQFSLSQLLASQADTLTWKNTKDASFKQYLKLLQTAVELAPQNRSPFIKLAKLAESKGEEKKPAIKVVEELLVNGKAPMYAHLVLGTVASREKDYSRASIHFEQAYSFNKNDPRLLNNLAWVLLRTKKTNHKRALQLIQRAMELDPRNIEMKETRGEAYLYNGDNENAIKDLEAVLIAFPKRTRLHNLLASAYDKIGMKSMAQKHLEQASSQ